VIYASAADLDHEPSACARTSSSRAFLRRPEPRVLWPVADAMRGRKVDMHFARAAKMSRSSRLVDAPPMLVPSADQHRVPQHVDHVPLATDPRATGGWQAAVRHDTVVSRRRRRHATAASSDFCVPFGGRASGRFSTPPTPSATTAARRRDADCIYGTDCADCGPRFPPPPPICAGTCNWASDADCDDSGPGSEFRPALGRRHVHPTIRHML